MADMDCCCEDVARGGVEARHLTFSIDKGGGELPSLCCGGGVLLL